MCDMINIHLLYTKGSNYNFLHTERYGKKRKIHVREDNNNHSICFPHNTTNTQSLQFHNFNTAVRLGKQMTGLLAPVRIQLLMRFDDVKSFLKLHLGPLL